MSPASSINGFSLIPVLYTPSTTHYIYARRHSSSKAESNSLLPSGRTLFLVNIPPDATERELILLFKHCGTVERVVFDFETKEPHHDEGESENDEDEDMEEPVQVDEQPRKRRKTSKSDVPTVTSLPSMSLRTLRRTGRSAHIVFLDTSSLDRAMSAVTKPRPWPESEEPRGAAHYRALYASLRPPLDVVREHADTSIELYEYQLAKEKQKSKYRKGEAIVDEDGFTLVTRGGAYGKTLGGGVGVASKRFQRVGESGRYRTKKKEKKEKEGFYAFQKAEKQRSGLFSSRFLL